MRGFTDAVRDAGVSGIHVPVADAPALDSLLRQSITALFVEEPADGVALVALAHERALRVPADLSLVALGDPTRPTTTDLDFSGFSIPRKEMGEQAVDVLTTLLEESVSPQRLLECELVAGSTLAERKA
jgi:DNA-binding LacI/PurR family transcriptional regulator